MERCERRVQWRGGEFGEERLTNRAVMARSVQFAASLEDINAEVRPAFRRWIRVAFRCQLNKLGKAEDAISEK